MPKQIATAILEGTRKRRPRKRWGDEDEEELNIMGIKKSRQLGPETVGDGRIFCAQPRSTTK